MHASYNDTSGISIKTTSVNNSSVNNNFGLLFGLKTDVMKPDSVYISDTSLKVWWKGAIFVLG